MVKITLWLPKKSPRFLGLIASEFSGAKQHRRRGNYGLKDKIKVQGLNSPQSAACGFNRYLDNFHAELLAVKILEALPVDEGCAAQAKDTSKHVVFPISFLS